MRALGERPGAIVALDPVGGEIAAMVSSPAYDSNRIEEDWPSLVGRPDAPLINRATQGAYQPGGALAPFVLAWAEREGLAGPGDEAPSIREPLTFDGRSLTCIRMPSDPRSPNLGEAMAYGCPTPFAELGVELGPSRLAEMLDAFGLSADPELGLHDGGVYILPEEEDPALAAAGQGSLTISPVRLARAFAALVNNGLLPELRIFDAQRLPGGEWTAMPTGPTPSATVPVEAADAVFERLPTLEGGARGLAARAAVGEPGDFVAWFAGFRAGRVVVVVLEGGDPADAMEAGMAVLLAGEAFP